MTTIRLKKGSPGPSHMESVLDTARFEVRRRIRRDLREDGELSQEGFDFILEQVARLYEVDPSDLEAAAIFELPNA